MYLSVKNLFLHLCSGLWWTHPGRSCHESSSPGHKTFSGSGIWGIVSGNRFWVALSVLFKIIENKCDDILFWSEFPRVLSSLTSWGLECYQAISTISLKILGTALQKGLVFPEAIPLSNDMPTSCMNLYGRCTVMQSNTMLSSNKGIILHGHQSTMQYWNFHAIHNYVIVMKHNMTLSHMKVNIHE